MKQSAVILLALLLAFSLFGCAQSDPDFLAHTVVINGISHTVDSRSDTIHTATHQYQYVYTPLSDGYEVTITYPDDTSYHYTQHGTFGTGGGTADEQKYASGVTLAEAIAAAEKSSRPFPFPLLLPLLLGVILILFPDKFWKLCYAIWVKDATPTTFAIWFIRGIGIVIVLLSLHLIIMG